MAAFNKETRVESNTIDGVSLTDSGRFTPKARWLKVEFPPHLRELFPLLFHLPTTLYEKPYIIKSYNNDMNIV